MSLTEKGRHCNSCNKVIIDYTKFTDAQLFEFIKSQKSIPCGRFYPHQLDIAIASPAKNKNERGWFNKIAASFIAFLSFNSLSVLGQKTPAVITTQPLQKINTPDSLPGKIIISGLVTDSHGNKLEKARVAFNGNLVAETDANGKYQFEVTDLTGRSYLLQFSYPKFVIASRSFYPAMGSTNYDIALAKPSSHIHYSCTMGIPIRTFLNFPDTTISFKFNDKKLTPESDSLIAELANQMRNYPDASITITGEVKSNKEINTCRKLTIIIRKKLIEEEGISPERIVFIQEPIVTKKQNLLRVESIKQE
jgi:hypothetical protein